MMVMLMLFLKLLDSLSKRILLLHSGKDILTVKLVPRSSNYSSGLVVLSDKLNCSLNLIALGNICVGKNYTRRVSNLIVIELAKVLHIHLALINVGNGCKGVKRSLVGFNGAHRLDNVGKLAYTAGLDNNSIGMVFIKHLTKRL